MLQIRQLSAGYDRQPVLSDINLTLPPGQWFALLGPNGAGKTTLLHCIAGMLAPSGGEIHVCGTSLHGDPQAAKRSLGFGCAPERLPGLLTGRQCLQVHAAAKAVPTPDALDGPLMALAESLQFSGMLDRFVDTYSTGTRQKLAVLLALVGEPRLIVLDEAFNGLDPGSALALKRHLRERIEGRHCSVLLATHGLDIVERYADRAALLLAGRLVHEWQADEIAALRAAPQGLEGAMAKAAAAAGGRGNGAGGKPRERGA
ncbi:MAG TPA: ABC transporter ATP-binding protein [Steroidobacteraceae bacterium]|nr:ABC transporter ATP-binding protein [Steroidobacteraceae bacterium]